MAEHLKDGNLSNSDIWDMPMYVSHCCLRNWWKHFDFVDWGGGAVGAAHTNCSNTVVLGWLKIQQGCCGHKTEYKSVMMPKECPAARHKGCNWRCLHQLHALTIPPIHPCYNNICCCSKVQSPAHVQYKTGSCCTTSSRCGARSLVIDSG